jgi:bacterioferritin-associated ferredoxin
MYVCLCLAITDRDAREAIDRGADSVGAVLRACGSGRLCGGCTPAIRELLRAPEGDEEDDVIAINRYREAR